MPNPAKSPRDLRETIVFCLVVTLAVVVGTVTIMGIVTAGLCGFGDRTCSPETIEMRTLRATLELVLPPFVGFVAAITGFYFGARSKEP